MATDRVGQYQLASAGVAEFAEYDSLTSSGELIWYGMQLEARDDIVRTLVRADADGQRLAEAEFGMFVVMLGIASNETTHNSIAQGMTAFTGYPNQWELFKTRRPKTAAGEIIHWATPITAFQPAGGDVLPFGQLRRGVSEDPFTFDVLRSPNPHLGFGGTGAHYCIGANLAGMTIDLMFNAIGDHLPDL